MEWWAPSFFAAAAMAVVWHLGDTFWEFTSLLCCCHLPGTEGPIAVSVYLGEVAAGIDIEVDFAAFDGEIVSNTALCKRILLAEPFSGFCG